MLVFKLLKLLLPLIGKVAMILFFAFLYIALCSSSFGLIKSLLNPLLLQKIYNEIKFDFFRIYHINYYNFLRILKTQLF